MYDLRILFDGISASLYEYPCLTLGDLSKNLAVGKRTIQKVISSANGRGFRSLRDEILLFRAQDLFRDHPGITVKEVAACLGYKSASSFARSIRRATGLSPVVLRSQLGNGPSRNRASSDSSRMVSALCFAQQRPVP